MEQQQEPCVAEDPLDAFMCGVATQIELDRCAVLRRLVAEKTHAVARFSKLIKVFDHCAHPNP